MLVIFAAFKKEAFALLKTIKVKEVIKNKSTLIFDGLIQNKRIIICITGMGSSNSIADVSLVTELNLKNPVFIIQGISGALADWLKTGDLVFYNSIKNLEWFNSGGKIIPHKASNAYIQTQNPEEGSVEEYEQGVGNAANTLYLPFGKKVTNADMDNYNLYEKDEMKAAFEALNGNFELLKNKWESNNKNVKLFMVSGGLVSYVVTNKSDMDILNKTQGVEAIDMESYYIADNATQKDIPVICIRSISDSPNEPIPELIIRFNEGGIYSRFCCLLELLFSRTKAVSVMRSLKNMTKACRNLNQFVLVTMLPYFGYEQE